MRVADFPRIVVLAALRVVARLMYILIVIPVAVVIFPFHYLLYGWEGTVCTLVHQLVLRDDYDFSEEEGTEGSVLWRYDVKTCRTCGHVVRHRIYPEDW